MILQVDLDFIPSAIRIPKLLSRFPMKRACNNLARPCRSRSLDPWNVVLTFTERNRSKTRYWNCQVRLKCPEFMASQHFDCKVVFLEFYRYLYFSFGPRIGTQSLYPAAFM